jgi:hypothetical protein
MLISIFFFFLFFSETTNNLQSINSLSSPKDVTRSFSMPFLINKYLDFQKQCKHYSVTAFFKRDLPAGILPMDVSTSKHKMYQNMILNHATQLAHRHEFWPYIGFYFFSQKTLEIYRYLESSASKHWYLKSLMSDSNINKDPLLSLSLSTAVFMLSNNLTMIEAISTSLNSKASDNFCAKKDEYFCMLHSMDKNADFVNATEYCSKIEKEGITVPFLQRCEKHLMTEKKINFDIEANFSVNPTYYNIYSPSNKEAEGNYYLLALTAIENLNRWFDYHRFCFNSLLSGLKNNFLDIEILPSWKSVHYFYVHYNKTVKTPAAILAKKVQKIKKRPETIVRYLLVVRDARTTMESFSQIDTDTLGETDTKKRGIFSQGYTKIFAFSAASILENIIRSEAKTLTKNHTIKVIVVAKGSYGVGTAMVILRELIDSLTPDTLIDSHFLANSKINYTMIAFSSNSVGDIDFINYLKRRATFRHIVEKNWFMHTHQNLQYPCEKEMEPISSVSKIIETVPGMVQVRIFYRKYHFFFLS